MSGMVLDNQNQPVEGVTASIAGTALQALSNAQGQFTLAGAPVGVHHLHIDGTTTTRPGLWASLEFELDVLPGVDNTIGMPIFLLPLDTENAKVVGGNQDVTLTLREVPGFSMTVFANSTTFPDGSRQGQVMVTQVHFDRVPMPPQEGIGPRLALTIQPAGVVFDPPARVTYPNVFGFKPGEVVNLFSFDHDLGEFVNVGTGSVSEDGSVFLSDPGVGIRKAGWHFPPPPTDPPTCAKTVDVRVTSSPKVLGVGFVKRVQSEGSLAVRRECPSIEGEFKWSVDDPTILSFPSETTGSAVNVRGESPGEAVVTVTYTVDGKSDTDSVRIHVRKVQFTVSYTTFIPTNSVQGPLPESFCLDGLDPKRLFLLGDDRSFDSTSSMFRTRQVVTVVTDAESDADGLLEGSAQSVPGLSQNYASDALDDGRIGPEDDDGVLNDCKLLDDEGITATSNMHITVTRVSDQKVSVHLFGGASDPLLLISPDISWDLTITVDTSGDQTVWTVRGAHDGFPAHEAYIDTFPLFTFDPGEPAGISVKGTPTYTFGQINALFPGLDIPVDKAGVLP